MGGKVSVVVGGQFGSEAKGAVAGYLASTRQNMSRSTTCVRVGGPNAGHTVYGRCPVECTDAHIKQRDDKDFENSHPWRLRQIPVAAVTNPNAALVIAAGSEVDFEVLETEIRQLSSAGYEIGTRLFVDKAATVLSATHINAEARHNMNGRLGSTAKGIGAARADRVWREAMIVGDITDGFLTDYVVTDTVAMLERGLRMHAHVVIEGTQGYGLGLHTEFYPMCTSGDTRAIDFLAQAGISPWAKYVEEFEVWVVARTRPIRVAGNSGPLKGETSWDALGLEAEKTTVTQRVRRVGEFDPELVKKAVHANGGGDDKDSVVKLALMMADYEIPGLKGATETSNISRSDLSRLLQLVYEVGVSTDSVVKLVGTSPTTLIDMRRQ